MNNVLYVTGNQQPTPSARQNQGMMLVVSAPAAVDSRLCKLSNGAYISNGERWIGLGSYLGVKGDTASLSARIGLAEADIASLIATHGLPASDPGDLQYSDRVTLLHRVVASDLTKLDGTGYSNGDLLVDLHGQGILDKDSPLFAVSTSGTFVDNGSDPVHIGISGSSSQYYLSRKLSNIDGNYVSHISGFQVIVVCKAVAQPTNDRANIVSLTDYTSFNNFLYFFERDYSGGDNGFVFIQRDSAGNTQSQSNPTRHSKGDVVIGGFRWWVDPTGGHASTFIPVSQLYANLDGWDTAVQNTGTIQLNKLEPLTFGKFEYSSGPRYEDAAFMEIIVTYGFWDPTDYKTYFQNKYGISTVN